MLLRYSGFCDILAKGPVTTKDREKAYSITSHMATKLPDHGINNIGMNNREREYPNSRPEGEEVLDVVEETFETSDGVVEIHVNSDDKGSLSASEMFSNSGSRWAGSDCICTCSLPLGNLFTSE